MVGRGGIYGDMHGDGQMVAHAETRTCTCAPGERPEPRVQAKHQQEAMMGRDEAEAHEALKALLKLAAANFPRTHDIRIETCGTNPHASLTIPYYFLANLLKAEPAKA